MGCFTGLVQSFLVNASGGRGNWTCANHALNSDLAALQMALWAKRDSDWDAAVDYSSAALTAFDREGSMNQGERNARQLLVEFFSRAGRDDEATVHCVALGEYQNASASTPGSSIVLLIFLNAKYENQVYEADYFFDSRTARGALSSWP